MDKIIFGDNQFFGINHMSEQASIKQAQRFRTTEDIFKLLEYVNSIGIKSFMFTTHDALEPVIDKIRNSSAFSDFKLLPCMPYAHKYANAMSEMGIFATIDKFTSGSKIMAGLKGLSAVVSSNPVPFMKLLVDSEMKFMKGLNVEGIFLQNIVVDLIIGLGMEDVLGEYAHYVEYQYGVQAGFITMNHTKLYDILTNKLGIKEPLMCSSINKIGFRMNPCQSDVENTLSNAKGTTIAMSILASGAVRPGEAVEYIRGLKGVDSILFGASTPAHILETKKLIDKELVASE